MKKYQQKYYLKNKEKIAEERKKYYQKNKEAYAKRKKTNYWPNKYGMTYKEVKELWVSQDKKCAICNIETILGTKALNGANVDHNHKTGKIRAILCRRCNTAIGLFKEDNKIILSAIKYLKKHKI